MLLPVAPTRPQGSEWRCPGQQGELEGAASLLEGFGRLLGKNTGDQATGEVTHNNSGRWACAKRRAARVLCLQRGECGIAGLSNQLQHTNKLVGRILVI